MKWFFQSTTIEQRSKQKYAVLQQDVSRIIEKNPGQSPGLLENTTMADNSTFLARNRTAIIATAATVASVAAAYYYVSSRKSTGDGSDESLPKSKKLKKKAKRTVDTPTSASTPSDSASSESSLAPEVAPVEKRGYPVDDFGKPAISSQALAEASPSQKESWASALKEDGNAEFKSKHYTEAIALYTAALTIKEDPVFYSNRSACYAALNDHASVIADTTKAIAIKNDYTKCILRRATSYEIIEEYENAMFDLTALTIYGNFSNKSIELVLERVLKKHSVKIVESKPSSENLPSAATIGAFFGAFVTEPTPEGISGEPLGADKFLLDAISRINGNTQNGYDEADALLKQALELYNVEELSPESPEANRAAIALEYASAFAFLKANTEEAAKLVDRAIALKPRTRCYVFRALINADKQSYVEAIADFETAKNLNSECPDTFYHLGQLHYLTGNFALAEENFARAKELNVDNVYAYIQLACIAYKNGDAADATNKFTAAKLRFPTSAEVPNYYGEILVDMGDTTAACKQFDVAAQLQLALPTFLVGSLPLQNKALCLSRESPDQLDEVETLLKNACELDPKSELARISLAQVMLQKEEVDSAIKYFEQALDLARTFEEKVQATSFAEATKMQKRIRNDPILTRKIAEVMQQAGMAQY